MKHASLPHHLSSSMPSLPPGIFGATRDTPPPAPPPLLDASGGAASPRAKRGGPADAAAPPPLLCAEAPEPEAAPAAAADATPAAASGGAGAAPGAGAEATPASDEPPKRKRLGWGQGLARLRTADSGLRTAEEQVAQSPRDSEASRHTDTNLDSLHSPSFSARVKIEPGFHPPSIASSPAIASNTAAQPVASPYSNLITGPSRSLPAPPPLLAVDAAETRSPLEARACLDSMGARGQKDATPFSPRQIRPEGFQGGPDLQGLGSSAAQGELPSQHSGLPPAESLNRPGQAETPEQAPAGPTKEDIMEDIDKVDTDISALEKEVADLAASLDATSAAAVALKGDISRLPAPLQPPQPVELSDEEDELQESSEVNLTLKLVMRSPAPACALTPCCAVIIRACS